MLTSCGCAGVCAHPTSANGCRATPDKGSMGSRAPRGGEKKDSAAASAAVGSGAARPPGRHARVEYASAVRAPAST